MNRRPPRSPLFPYTTLFRSRLRASAQRYSSASREVTIRTGGSGRSKMFSNISRQEPGAMSRSVTTSGILARHNAPIADSTVAQGRSVHFDSLHRIRSDRSKMELNEVWSSSIGLTDSTVTVAETIPLAGGFLMVQLLTSPLDRRPAG